ncbi:MAG: hypothetical protein AAFT19_09635 [Pseudomonadota bacterium]
MGIVPVSSPDRRCFGRCQEGKRRRPDGIPIAIAFFVDQARKTSGGGEFAGSSSARSTAVCRTVAAMRSRP